MEAEVYSSYKLTVSSKRCAKSDRRHPLIRVQLLSLRGVQPETKVRNCDVLRSKPHCVVSTSYRSSRV